MLKVTVEYPNLSFSVRKVLAARHDLLVGSDRAFDTLATRDRGEQAKRRDAALKLASLTITSRDANRLDVYLREALTQAGAKHAGVAPSADCTRCARGLDNVCRGADADAQLVNDGGECIKALKLACDLAIETANELYMEAFGRCSKPCHVQVQLTAHADCPKSANASFCVGGASQYDDGEHHTTTVTIDIGLEHWTLESCAALCLILSHELVCHACLGICREGARTGTTNSDAYTEGWMDFVARSTLVAKVNNKLAALRPGEEWAELALVVDSELTKWRNAESWPGPCHRKNNDLTSHRRRTGERQARRMQAKLGTSRQTDFLSLSTSFHASGESSELGEALIEDAMAFLSLHGPNEDHRFRRALDDFCSHHNIDRFVQQLKAGRAADA